MSDLLPEQRPPKQPEPVGSALADMDLAITCTPPLGQPTTISASQHSVWFSILTDYPVDGWREPQICVWHNHNGEHEWNELHLKPTSGIQENILTLHHESGNDGKRKGGILFRGTLSGLPKHGHVVSFTIKYRLGPKSEWQWIKDSTGIADGELHYQCSADFRKHASYHLNHFFSDISPDIRVASQPSETEHTQLYSLTCPVKPCEGEESGYQRHQLGKANHCSRWFALVRLWSPWLAPRQGKGGSFELDKEAILLSFLRSDGLHVVCLAISGLTDVLTTFVHEDGKVMIKGRSDCESESESHVLVAVAESFEVANCAVMYHARKVMAEHGGSLDGSTKTISNLTESNVRPEWLEEWYDGLTYCTWNGLGQNLTAQKIYDALDDLASNNINITNLIIDDNWQSLSVGESQFKRGWSDFEANSWGFPDGLRKTTAEIRRRHPKVNHIAVWHAMLGYWGGIDPHGNIAKKYKTIEVEKEPGLAGGKFTVVAPDDVQQMYDDFYAFLSQNGVDAVKTDAQFFLDLLRHAPDRRKMIFEYEDAWTLAHLRHFNSRAISCMSQFPQCLFATQLPRNKPRLLIRNSDDFFPDVDASHPWHIFCNAHNSLFTQHLNALPDWDMFQTSHSWASFHAAARCVSGGPIYFTDKPGEHDIALIGQMTAQTTRGKTIILRPTIIGKAVDMYNEYDAHTLLKIGTYVGMSDSGSGVLGIFNVSKRPLREFVHLEAFPGTENDDYVVGSFRSGKVSNPMRRGQEHAMVSLGLDARDWEILTAYALQTFTLPSADKPVSVAIMGLVGKMTGAAAVMNSDVNVETNGRLRISVKLKALGVLGIWLSDLEDRSVQEHFMVVMAGMPVPLHCVKTTQSILEVDVERAWIEMGIKPGWSNEVGVEVFVG